MTIQAAPPAPLIESIPTRRRAGGDGGRFLRHPWLPPLLGVAILLVAWEIVGLTIAQGRHIIPPFSEVIMTMASDGFYLEGIKVTLWEAARGYLWGNLAALAVAAICVLLPALQDTLTRLAMATYSTPTIAVAPLLIVLFAPDGAKVSMAALSVFFPTLLGALVGLNSAPKSALEFVHVAGGSRTFALLQIRLRAAVPELAAALSLAAPAAIVGAMIGEYLGGDQGLGVVLVQAQQSLHLERAWAIALVATLISTVAFLLIGGLAKKLAFTATSTDLSMPVVAATTGRRKNLALGSLRGLASFVFVIFLWWVLVTMSGLDSFIAKTPDKVWTYLTAGPEAALNRETMVAALGVTLFDAALGYVAGTALAVLVALVFLSSRIFEGMFLPIVMTIRAVPLVAMTPLIALIFGRGVLTVIVLAGAVTFVPTLVIVLAALRGVPKPSVELAHVYGMSKLRTLISVRLPYAIPAFAASARIAIPGAILGAVLVEILVTGTGIGYLIATSIGRSEYIALWTALVILSFVTAFIYMLLSRVEAKLISRISQ